MSITTFLSENELNIPLKQKAVQEILDEVRETTGEDWQVVPIQTVTGHLWWRKATTDYGLYVFVGGCGPWQQINFPKSGSESSINPYVSIDFVATYLLGILAGVWAAVKQEQPSKDLLNE